MWTASQRWGEVCAGRSRLCRQARKGSARFSKRQNSKSKSPRTSLSSADADAAVSEGMEERAAHSRPLQIATLASLLSRSLQ
jgi:hypothetical protein